MPFLAEEGREISDDDKKWDDRTDRMTRESVLFIGTEFSILYTSRSLCIRQPGLRIRVLGVCDRV